MVTQHQFQSAVADGGDATLVRPSNWNDEHTSPNLLTANVVQPDNNSSYVSGTLDLATFTFEIGSGSVLEIS